QPGPLTLEVKQYGSRVVDHVEVRSYAESARIDSFVIHAGDTTGLLRGTRLDQVGTLAIDGIPFSPGDLSRSNNADELKMAVSSAESATKLHAAQNAQAQVTLNDGRVLTVQADIKPPRPQVALLGKTVESIAGSLTETDARIELNSPDEMSQQQVLR